MCPALRSGFKAWLLACVEDVVGAWYHFGLRLCPLETVGPQYRNISLGPSLGNRASAHVACGRQSFGCAPVRARVRVSLVWLGKLPGQFEFSIPRVLVDVCIMMEAAGRGGFMGFAVRTLGGGLASLGMACLWEDIVP